MRASVFCVAQRAKVIDSLVIIRDVAEWADARSGSVLKPMVLKLARVSHNDLLRRRRG